MEGRNIVNFEDAFRWLDSEYEGVTFGFVQEIMNRIKSEKNSVGLIDY